jgi:hypothetical protein
MRRRFAPSARCWTSFGAGKSRTSRGPWPHYGRPEDEGITYDREIAWYEHLRQSTADRLEGDERRWFEWAVASAVASAAAAREKAATSRR